jgi:hypothetical protein
MTISPELQQKHPFWRLSQQERSDISKALRAKFVSQGGQENAFNASFKSVLSAMQGKLPEEQLLVGAQQLLKSLNGQATRYLETIPAWQATLGDVTILTGLLSLGAQASQWGAMVPAGVALLCLRSHKVLAVASGCVACALLVFSSICWKLNGAFERHYQLISDLNLENFDQFEGSVQEVYEGLKKTHVLIRIYLNKRQAKMTECPGSQLLWDELAAVFQIKLMMRLYKTSL